MVAGLTRDFKEAKNASGGTKERKWRRSQGMNRRENKALDSQFLIPAKTPQIPDTTPLTTENVEEAMERMSKGSKRLDPAAM